jgi:hypothetical protein
MRHGVGGDDGGDDAEGYTGPSTPVYSDQDWTRASGAGEADGARRDPTTMPASSPAKGEAR